MLPARTHKCAYARKPIPVINECQPFSLPSFWTGWPWAKSRRRCTGKCASTPKTPTRDQCQGSRKSLSATRAAAAPQSDAKRRKKKGGDEIQRSDTRNKTRKERTSQIRQHRFSFFQGRRTMTQVHSQCGSHQCWQSIFGMLLSPQLRALLLAPSISPRNSGALSAFAFPIVREWTRFACRELPVCAWVWW